MNEPDPPAAIPWWKSAVVRRLAYSIVVQILALTGWSKYLVGIDAMTLTDELLEAAGIAYAAGAAHARIVRPMPAITLTQSSADVVNTLPKDSEKKS